MKIQVYIRCVYGSTRVYPVCPKALALAKLSGATTLTPEALRIIKELGYELEILPDPRAKI